MSKNGFYIDNFFIKNRIALAPMAGISDVPYRQVHLEHGVGYAVSEMVLANEQFLKQGHSLEHLNFQEYKESDFQKYLVPRSLQILGHSPDDMATLTKLIVKHNLADIIDINMGCPAKKVVKKAAGSALMADPKLVKDILQSVIKAAGSTPVTLKMRTGVDSEHRNALELALMAQDLGIKAITLHGRTRKDLFKGHAEYQTIKELKQELEIPVIANGDIDSVEKLLYVKDITNADAFMVGRASQGDPWLIAKLVAIDEGKKYYVPTKKEKFCITVQHLLNIQKSYQEIIGVKIARKHFIWYLEKIFPEVYYKKTYNNLEEQIENNFLIPTNLSHKKIIKELIIENTANEIFDKQEIETWKSTFIKLNSYREQEVFLLNCIEFLNKKNIP
ncbi:tRNA dihydrouridine synthase DusB [Psittacicella gerlachiana]|uniref:tRNA dihydrouridine synthase DusB n=1 Tax=Psittacicella gerlachiana TaxID=2028574 RepID=A0A3A1YAX1_9GAMM|nr:tRNA dihydrouridine synthase DusB [Psittacicella gerlachiana]RIY34389.1 tRNA dihydrouridine synthase DusB [Psittacicella gerlachiana]